jgi:hypothetical protein
VSVRQPRVGAPPKVVGIEKRLDHLSVRHGCGPVDQFILCQVPYFDTDPKPYQRGKLIMIAHKYELLGETQWAKTCRQRDLGGFVYYAVIEFPA